MNTFQDDFSQFQLQEDSELSPSKLKDFDQMNERDAEIAF